MNWNLNKLELAQNFRMYVKGLFLEIHLPENKPLYTVENFNVWSLPPTGNPVMSPITLFVAGITSRFQDFLEPYAGDPRKTL